MKVVAIATPDGWHIHFGDGSVRRTCIPADQHPDEVRRDLGRIVPGATFDLQQALIDFQPETIGGLFA